jgi:hypothetical protein
MIKTILLQIINPEKIDDYKWSVVANKLNLQIEDHCYKVHYKGKFSRDDTTQEFCWVFEIEEEKVEGFKTILKDFKFQNDIGVVSLTEGKTIIL